MNTLKSLFEALEPMTEADNRNLAKELQLEREIKDVSQAIKSNIEEATRTPFKDEALEVLLEEFLSYTSQLTELQIKNA